MKQKDNVDLPRQERLRETFGKVYLKSALPYIIAHKDKSLVFVLPSTLVHEDNKTNNDFWEDLIICHSLGIRCIVCLEGAEMSSARNEGESQVIPPAKLQDLRYELTEKTRQCIGHLTRAAHNIRGHVSVLTGNWALAQPVGAVDGVDYQRRGKLRRLHTDFIRDALETGNILLLSNLAMDKGGQDYVVPTMDIIDAFCNSLDIKKIIFYTPSLPPECRSLALDVRDVNAAALREKLPQEVSSFVRDAEYFCRYFQVDRVHMVAINIKHALLEELFTTDGRGMMLHSDIYERLEAPEPSDMHIIKKMIEPMEKAGVLRPRSVQVLKEARARFRVIKQDGKIVGCAALSPLKKNSGYAELECVVVRQEFAGRGYGSRLLRSMERLATETNYSHLIVMSTQSVTWFREHGYMPTDQKIEVHPDCKQRKAKVLIKALAE